MYVQVLGRYTYVTDREVNVGDEVYVSFGYYAHPNWRAVTAVGPTLESVKSSYTGPLKQVLDVRAPQLPVGVTQTDLTQVLRMAEVVADAANDLVDKLDRLRSVSD